MVHDVRDFNLNFFPKRYEMQSFLTWKDFLSKLDIIGFENLIKNYKFNFSDKELKNNNVSLLTFDDGLKDHFKIAKYLSQKKINSIFFVPVEAILNHKMVESHKIQFILASADHERLVKDISKQFTDYKDMNADQLNPYYISKWKKNVWSKEMVFITRILREGHDVNWRQNTIDDLFKKYVTRDEKNFANEFYLSLDEVYEISKMGHVIGGHGFTSRDLRFLKITEVIFEINQSIEFIKKFNPKHLFFAYPNGGFNKNICDALKNSSFSHCFTTQEANLEINSDTMYTPRFDLTKLEI